MTATLRDLLNKRLGNRLRVQQEIPRELLRAKVPPLILQPLVENAIRHGIEPFARQGLVLIRVFQQGYQVILEVVDNGPGFTPGDLQEGVGLTNCRQRLRQYYGEQGCLSFHVVGEGATVRLALPLHWMEMPKPDGTYD